MKFLEHQSKTRAISLQAPSFTAVRHQLNSYKKDPNILGVLLFGSVARRIADRYSDVDVYILVRKPIGITRRNQLVDGIRYDEILDTPAEARRYLHHERSSVRRPFAHMLRHGRILFDRDQNLKRLRAVAKRVLKSRTRYTRTEVLMHLYSIDDFFGEVQRWYHKQNPVAFELNSHLLVQNLIELFLKLKGDYQRRPNELADVLKKHDARFARLFGAYAKSNQPAVRLRYLRNLVQHVYDLAGGPMPKKWAVK